MTGNSVLQKISVLINKLSLTERIISAALLLVFIFSGYILIANYLSSNYFVEVPVDGGVLKEGSIGNPRFINPLLAVSETDRDLTSLVYSGLMRATPDGDLIPDLAEKVEVSEDGLRYSFTIKQNAKFQDGEPVTADDVIFTINKAKDIELKSPKRSNWEGIEMERVDERTIVFVLARPYAPFLQNTTIGILPRHIWDGVTSNEFSLSIFNIEPIGSGPFSVDEIKRDSVGIPRSYILKPFKEFVLGKPHLDKIEFIFAKNEQELADLIKSGSVNAIHGIGPEKAKELSSENYNVSSVVLPRVFAVFFNQSQSAVLGSSSVREALSLVAPRGKIVSDVLFGYGEEIAGPVPNNLIEYEKIGSDIPQSETEEELIAEAQSILEEAGWEKNEEGTYVFTKGDDKKILSFSIATSNVPELVKSAQIVVDSWKKIGADVDLKVFEPSDFSQNIIRPRNYDAILFGLIVGRDLDLYAFWHSSQRNDPGLNISGYANITTDALLEDIRKTSDRDEINEKIIELEKEIAKDNPAVFLYSPKFAYIMPREMKGVNFNNIISTEERFFNVYEWYVETDRVLKIFIKD